MQELGVKSVYILNDKEVYGKGVADATASAAEKLGITVIANEGYDPKAPNYDALFEQIKPRTPTPSTSARSSTTTVASSSRTRSRSSATTTAVKLIGPDGMLVNDLPTDEQAGAAAEGMYLTFAGLGPDQIKERGGAAAEFLTAYKAKYGKPGGLHGLRRRRDAGHAEGDRGVRRHPRERRRRELFKVAVPEEESLLGEEYSLRRERRHDAEGHVRSSSVKGTDIPFEQGDRGRRRRSSSA